MKSLSSPLQDSFGFRAKSHVCKTWYRYVENLVRDLNHELSGSCKGLDRDFIKLLLVTYWRLVTDLGRYAGN